jgi:hypothetical protein
LGSTSIPVSGICVPNSIAGVLNKEINTPLPTNLPFYLPPGYAARQQFPAGRGIMQLEDVKARIARLDRLVMAIMRH